MKSALYVQNLRCGGCATSISIALSIIQGIIDINIIPDDGKVTFTAKDDSARLEAIFALKKLGYPVLHNSNSIKDKAMSIVNCVKGKVQR